ncbi:MAG: formate--tetrahydrofolate ligase [Comamonadaceae bacterium]|nr:formate--tetrahydrofolate ligase [Comamonadaceae bacterium]
MGQDEDDRHARSTAPPTSPPTPRCARRSSGCRTTGYGHYPVCVAKTQYSFSTDPQLRGAPSGHVVNIREVRLAAGAEFVVMICGDIMTMPGLPKVPSAATRSTSTTAGGSSGCS